MSKQSKFYDMQTNLENLRNRQTAEGVLHFFQEMTGAEFLVPCEGQAANVAVLNTASGEHLIPLFSDAEELKPGKARWNQVTALRLEFLALCVLTQPEQFTGLVINPLTEKPVIIRRREIIEAMKLRKAYNNKELN